jgi:3',5'-cyclic AMP phosphodiesterase CpdA
MQRRRFLGKIAKGTSTLILAPKIISGKSSGSIQEYRYGVPGSLQEILSKEGQAILRVQLRTTESVEPVYVDMSLTLEGGSLKRVKHYFFEPGSKIDPDTGGVSTHVNLVHPGVLVAWIDNPADHTMISLNVNKKTIKFTLAEMIDKVEITTNAGEIQVTGNYLLDREISFLTPGQMGIKEPADPENFSFAIMADTQGGKPGVPGSSDTRIKIHNAFLEETIKRANELDPQPVFTLILGDVTDAQGEKEHFVVMNRFFKRMKSPVIWEMGNHESSYRSEFSPGYRMDDFDNYYAAQKDLNGMEELLYSFNIGRWHFVVWPDPLRNEFWENHPHYFDWLERDLEANKERHVIFMQHIPIHPIGIDPIINYAESVTVKQMVADLLSKHGNVRYVFSGHVHIPVRSSFKTAVTYRNMKMINLPAAGYRPRGFGEEEWHGGPSQGLLVVDIKGDDAFAYFKTVTEEIYRYPERLPEFDDCKYPLWFFHKWELPSFNQIQNGDFENGLKGWGTRYVYQETENPSNIIEVRKMARDKSFSALYVCSKKRMYHTPGQDRLPQNINHLCQTVNIDNKPGILKFDYLIDSRNTDMGKYCGAFVWIEGFRGRFQLLNMAYWTGFSEVNIGGKHSCTHVVPPHHFHLDETMDTWHSVTVNLEKDSGSFGKTISELRLDKLAINIGTWNINDGNPISFAAYFDRFRLEPHDEMIKSNVDGTMIIETPSERKWWRNKYEQFVNIAGEHRMMLSTGK